MGIPQTNCEYAYPQIYIDAPIPKLQIEYYGRDRNQSRLARFFSKKKFIHLPVRACIIADVNLSIHDPLIDQAIDVFLKSHDQHINVKNPNVPAINYTQLLMYYPPNWAFESTIANDQITIAGNLTPMSIGGFHFPSAPRENLEAKLLIIDRSDETNFDHIKAVLLKGGIAEPLVDKIHIIYSKSRDKIYYRDAVYNEIQFDPN
jgi:hypothetical protein